jgi:hypothetical protein
MTYNEVYDVIENALAVVERSRQPGVVLDALAAVQRHVHDDDHRLCGSPEFAAVMSSMWMIAAYVRGHRTAPEYVNSTIEAAARRLHALLAVLDQLHPDEVHARYEREVAEARRQAAERAAAADAQQRIAVERDELAVMVVGCPVCDAGPGEGCQAARVHSERVEFMEVEHVACGYCFAAVHAFCVTDSGRVTRCHAERRRSARLTADGPR